MKAKTLSLKLLNLCRQDPVDLDAIETVLSQMTPRQVVQLAIDNPEVDITGYPVWAIRYVGIRNSMVAALDDPRRGQRSGF